MRSPLVALVAVSKIAKGKSQVSLLRFGCGALMLTGTEMLGVFHAFAKMQYGLNRGSSTGPRGVLICGNGNVGEGHEAVFQYGIASSGVIRISIPSGILQASTSLFAAATTSVQRARAAAGAHGNRGGGAAGRVPIGDRPLPRHLAGF